MGCGCGRAVCSGLAAGQLPGSSWRLRAQWLSLGAGTAAKPVQHRPGLQAEDVSIRSRGELHACGELQQLQQRSKQAFAVQLAA